MKTKWQSSPRPFLMQFAERILNDEMPVGRYDAERQITQVRVGGKWIDAVDSECTLQGSTKKTGVGQETTDDD